MSDVSQGPGWWQAADLKWYPPEQSPGATPVTGPPPSMPSYGPPAGTPAPIDTKGFVKSLYDFKFDHFVTPKVLSFFYAFFVIALSLAAVVLVLAALASGEPTSIVAALIVIPLGYFVYLVFIRMYFELVSALFRIADDLRAVRRSKGV
ncbi:MAG: hypothetical protein JWM47_1763 [Acidimicrobiales bacterium]|nr:hypothetical protein [Acidimicrobiales bacterium]